MFSICQKKSLKIAFSAAVIFLSNSVKIGLYLDLKTMCKVCSVYLTIVGSVQYPDIDFNLVKD